MWRAALYDGVLGTRWGIYMVAWRLTLPDRRSTLLCMRVRLAQHVGSLCFACVRADAKRRMRKSSGMLQTLGVAIGESGMALGRGWPCSYVTRPRQWGFDLLCRRQPAGREGTPQFTTRLALPEAISGSIRVTRLTR